MPAKASAPDISDEAVQAKTGRTWPQWFALLDEAGAPAMTHPQIAKYLAQSHNVSGWWAQAVTVGYERAHGRAKHQRPDGYSVSVSKTFSVPVSKVFHAWHDARSRARWLLGAPFTIRKATADKSLRVSWGERENLDIGFYPKGNNRCQVALEHSKLPNARAAAKAKTDWAEALARLKVLLEK